MQALMVQFIMIVMHDNLYVYESHNNIPISMLKVII